MWKNKHKENEGESRHVQNLVKTKQNKKSLACPKWASIFPPSSDINEIIQFSYLLKANRISYRWKCRKTQKFELFTNRQLSKMAARMSDRLFSVKWASRKRQASVWWATIDILRLKSVKKRQKSVKERRTIVKSIHSLS